MSNLDNLLKKIIDDAKEEADFLIQQAKEKKTEIIAEKQAAAKEEVFILLEEAEREAEQIRDRTVSGAELKARDEILKAKGEVIQSVFLRALAELRQLDDETYLQFLRKQLEKVAFDSMEKLVVPKGKGELVSSLDLPVPVEEKEIVKSGFLLIGEKYIFNQTFESILDYHRDKLELDAARILFD